MGNTAPQYPHGRPESPGERQDLLERLMAERYPGTQRAAHVTPKRPAGVPVGWETGPTVPNGGYTPPNNRRNGAEHTPDTPREHAKIPGMTRRNGVGAG